MTSANTRVPGDLSASAPARALAPDLARGFMLLLIAIANVSTYLWARPVPIYTLHPRDGSPIDTALSALAILFVDARVYPMFAFLFGYGMVQFARSRQAKGVPQRSIDRVLLRRHLWLVAFGFVHAALLFSGDILGAYGLTGLALTALLFWRSDRVVGIVASAMLGLAALGTVLLSGALALAALFVPAEFLASAATDEGFADGVLGAGIEDYGRSMLDRIGSWLIQTPATVLMLLVPACVLLGWIAGRHRWLEVATSRLELGAAALWGTLVSVAAALPLALLSLGALPESMLLGLGFSLISSLGGVAGGIAYAALFGLLARRLGERPGAAARAVAAVGKRSLSSYLLQSILLAPLLSAWGFGLGARIGTAAAFALALGAWLLSLVFAVLLERRGARGPAEVLLRKLSYGREASSVRP
ncbi:DUF418 domain-containing protein [Leucobacter luti]|uniref:Putative membrane protein YeiB n=1 Tax=Leucobacter luti TaxID=340320 RepID=A0A4Q7U0T0_9MICO|nr:DUF418 domain-containing protein [Leucobacter luti]RZT67011.1 putative membrane protein YeiB [Leucobacter luti]